MISEMNIEWNYWMVLDHVDISHKALTLLRCTKEYFLVNQDNWRRANRKLQVVNCVLMLKSHKKLPVLLHNFLLKSLLLSCRSFLAFDIYLVIILNNHRWWHMIYKYDDVIYLCRPDHYETKGGLDSRRILLNVFKLIYLYCWESDGTLLKN